MYSSDPMFLGSFMYMCNIVNEQSTCERYTFYVKKKKKILEQNVMPELNK